ncbi:hypothetical protein N2152v2_007009 [Parachlorella kessleri]
MSPEMRMGALLMAKEQQQPVNTLGSEEEGQVSSPEDESDATVAGGVSCCGDGFQCDDGDYLPESEDEGDFPNRGDDEHEALAADGSESSIVTAADIGSAVAERLRRRGMPEEFMPLVTQQTPHVDNKLLRDWEGGHYSRQPTIVRFPPHTHQWGQAMPCTSGFHPVFWASGVLLASLTAYIMGKVAKFQEEVLGSPPGRLYYDFLPYTMSASSGGKAVSRETRTQIAASLLTCFDRLRIHSMRIASVKVAGDMGRGMAAVESWHVVYDSDDCLVKVVPGLSVRQRVFIVRLPNNQLVVKSFSISCHPQDYRRPGRVDGGVQADLVTIILGGVSICVPEATAALKEALKQKYPLTEEQLQFLYGQLNNENQDFVKKMMADKACSLAEAICKMHRRSLGLKGGLASDAKQRENPEKYHDARVKAGLASDAKQRENPEKYHDDRVKAGLASDAKQRENPEKYHDDRVKAGMASALYLKGQRQTALEAAIAETGVDSATWLPGGHCLEDELAGYKAATAAWPDTARIRLAASFQEDHCQLISLARALLWQRAGKVVLNGQLYSPLNLSAVQLKEWWQVNVTGQFIVKGANLGNTRSQGGLAAKVCTHIAEEVKLLRTNEQAVHRRIAKFRPDAAVQPTQLVLPLGVPALGLLPPTAAVQQLALQQLLAQHAAQSAVPALGLLPPTAAVQQLALQQLLAQHAAQSAVPALGLLPPTAAVQQLALQQLLAQHAAQSAVPALGLLPPTATVQQLALQQLLAQHAAQSAVPALGLLPPTAAVQQLALQQLLAQHAAQSAVPAQQAQAPQQLALARPE